MWGPGASRSTRGPTGGQQQQANKRWIAVAAAAIVAAALYLTSRTEGPAAANAHKVAGSGGWPAITPTLQQGAPTCSDTCAHARDGVCDEGWGPRVRHEEGEQRHSVLVRCDLGTDCTDCGGPWAGHLPGKPNWPEAQGPVAWLQSKGETLRVRQTTTQPSFLMPITDAKADPDVSSMLNGYGHMEGGITRAVHSVLSSRCVDASLPGGRALVLVVGANMGYFALQAAMMGCRVVAWEPVPLLYAYLAFGAALNNLTHLVQVRHQAVSDLEPGSSVTLGVPKHGTYWGLASVDNLNLHPHEERYRVSAVTERLDDLVPASQPVLMLKIDVEGYEPYVLQSARRIITTRQARHIFMEYSPGIAERHRDWQLLRALSTSLQLVLQAGYKAGHMPTFAVAAPWPPKDMSVWYGAPFPVLEEVGLPEVEADLQAADLRLRTEGTKGQCHVPEALAKFGPWRACGEWTRTVHPKGFRSSHGYNTNLFASLDAAVLSSGAASAPQQEQEGVLRLQGHAALFGRQQPVAGAGAAWTSASRPNVGIGLLACDGIGQGHRVLHRCACADAAMCGDEQAALEALTRTPEGVFYRQ